ncbi:hypothetical protein [Gordonia caeni]|uniref:Peptidase C39-like domain-containing protein n=1 Tax=Gordonia caeni TaxID=1007097 RepID=A0ABP7NT51_9ACTN
MDQLDFPEDTPADEPIEYLCDTPEDDPLDPGPEAGEVPELPADLPGVSAPAGGAAAEEYSEHWFTQAANGTCVPASVAQIVSEYTGTTFADESVFVQYALDHGLFADGVIENGMTAEAGAQILEASGIPATVAFGDLATLQDLLDGGHGVMVAVDSGYWDPGQEVVDQLTGTDQGADHCVVISEIDVEKGVVYLSDTGGEGGDMLEVPLYRFEEAWAESGNQMIVCDVPSPNIEFASGETGLPAAQPTAATEPAGFGSTQAGSTQAGAEVPAGVAGGTEDSTGLADAIGWLTHNPWVLMPVVLGAGVAVKSVATAATTSRDPR